MDAFREIPHLTTINTPHSSRSYELHISPVVAFICSISSGLRTYTDPHYSLRQLRVSLKSLINKATI